MKTLVISSLYGNPISSHHIDYLEACKDLGYRHVCIVNNDTQVKAKGSIPFQSCEERIRIVSSLRCVDVAWRSQDIDRTVRQTIRTIWELNYDKYDDMIFANGGDVNNCAERELCEELGIRLLYGVGGAVKTGSSSNLIEKAAIEWVKKNQKKALSLIM